MQMTCNLPDHAAAVECLLEGFVRVCQLCIEAGLAPPDPLDVAGIEYKLEGMGEEDWKLPQNVIRDRWGDCEDLAGWRAGGLRATGEDPEARVVVVRTGKGKLHAVVRRGDGSLDDPSRDLRDRSRTVAMLGGGGTTVNPRGSGASGGGGGGAPPAQAYGPPPTSSPAEWTRSGGHKRLDPTSQRYQRGQYGSHPMDEAMQQAAQLRVDRGEGTHVTSQYGRPQSTTVDTNAPPPVDPNDPSTWPPFDPNDPSTWKYYGYDPSQGYGGYPPPGGYGGYDPYGAYGGGYGYPGDSYYPEPYAGGFPWGTPPEAEDLSPSTDWEGLDVDDGGDWE